MKTMTIQIGNSDDKLTQKEWNAYWNAVNFEISNIAFEIHFVGGSDAVARWQNYCWVIAISEANEQALKNFLTVVRTRYQQDSVAVTVGTTMFV
jgi:hypothetical protein